MPKLELKAVQKELEDGLVRPFYWIYGPEKLKSRELLKRIRAVVSPHIGTGGLWGWGEEILDGSETTASALLDAALSPTLGGGVKLIVVRDAHSIKNPEPLSELFGPPQKLTALNFVCICLAKDLDGRKKFSKVLTEKAAVVPCDEVPEGQRDAWIQFLAKRRRLNLDPSLSLKLSTLDPWSLDIIEQELEKYSIAQLSADVFLEGNGFAKGADGFLESFFSRDLVSALPQVSYFAEFPDESLPLLGLMGWNVRQLALYVSDREKGTHYSKLNPYVAEKFRKWGAKWKLDELLELQHQLSEIDFSIKQTPLKPLGLWSHLVTRFCQI